MAHIRVKPMISASYPICQICGKSMHKPCSIMAPPMKEPLLSCVSCYRIWMTLQYMAHLGLIDTLEEVKCP